jgi:predicted transcriptional regulator
MAVIKAENCPAEMKKALKDLAKTQKESESAILRRAVKMYIDSKKVHS